MYFHHHKKCGSRAFKAHVSSTKLNDLGHKKGDKLVEANEVFKETVQGDEDKRSEKYLERLIKLHKRVFSGLKRKEVA